MRTTEVIHDVTPTLRLKNRKGTRRRTKMKRREGRLQTVKQRDKTSERKRTRDEGR